MTLTSRPEPQTEEKEKKTQNDLAVCCQTAEDDTARAARRQDLVMMKGWRLFV